MYIRCDIPFTGNNTIKEVFDSKYFHGRLTDEEAENLCKEELTKTGKPFVYIWYLSEVENHPGLENGRLMGTIYRQEGDFEGAGILGNPHTVHPQYFDFWMHRQSWDGFRHMDYLVERKNPITLLELARLATLDNCNGYCCLRSLIEKIDQLRLPTREKEEIKKLAHGFHNILVENLPTELCIH